MEDSAFNESVEKRQSVKASTGGQSVSVTVEGITRSLEVFAEQTGDLNAGLYARYFALNREADALLGHADTYVLGRMTEQVVDLLLNEEHDAPGAYLDWELDNHLDAYGATPQMYRDFFEALLETVREGCGDGWDDYMARAWQSRVLAIQTRVDAHS